MPMLAQARPRRALFITGGLLLLILSALSGPTPALAQAGPRKDTPLDRYPLPRADGALAFSLGDRWPSPALTYHFNNCPAALPCEEAHEAVRQAFAQWAAVSSLTFGEVEVGNQADLEITWTMQDAELGTPGDALTFAYFPGEGGDIFFDDAEPWTLGDGGDADLGPVALHAIGHALGLDHSADPNAIMYAYGGFAEGLGDDDLRAIQALYPADSAGDAATGGATSTPLPDSPAPPQEEGAVSGEINNDTPYEVWELEVAGGETLIVTMTTVAGDLQPYLGIMDAALETVLVEGGEQPGGGTARLIYTFEQAGVYNIIATRVDVEDGATAGRYTLVAQFGTGMGGVPPETFAVRVTFANRGSLDLCALYFSPDYNPEWGVDFLQGQPLAPGATFELELDLFTYDLLVVTCDGQAQELYTIGVDAPLQIGVYDEAIEVGAAE